MKRVTICDQPYFPYPGLRKISGCFRAGNVDFTSTLCFKPPACWRAGVRCLALPCCYDNVHPIFRVQLELGISLTRRKRTLRPKLPRKRLAVGFNQVLYWTKLGGVSKSHS